jgi:selenocysteine lyase/cysteine desulfurase
VSNVFGFIQPVEDIAAICRSRRVPFIIDASQSAGVLPLNMGALGAAFIAMPGHKGLYGPQGTGVLLCREDVPTRPLLEGGTGSQSIQQQMPDFLPDRLEAGTLNMPGIAGLLAGIRYVRRGGQEKILAHEKHLTQIAAQGLAAMPGMRIFASPGLRHQTGVLSLTVEGLDVESIGSALAERGFAVRTGIHCAPSAHRTAGTLDTGTVRVSFSDFNTPEEVARLLRVFPGALGRAF